MEQHPTIEQMNRMKRSELLRLAIADLERLKKNGLRVGDATLKVKEFGAVWVKIPKKNDEPCLVCLAGATFVSIGLLVNDNHEKFGAALNILRMGYYFPLFEQGKTWPEEVYKPVNESFKKSKKEMATVSLYKRFATFLEKKGL